jgi:hypothetical protein
VYFYYKYLRVRDFSAYVNDRGSFSADIFKGSQFSAWLSEFVSRLSLIDIRGNVSASATAIRFGNMTCYALISASGSADYGCLFISTLSGSMTSMRPFDLVSPAVASASASSRSEIFDLRREPRSAGQITESETSSFIIIPVQMVEYIQARLWRSSAFLSQTLQADGSKTDWS